MVDDDWERVQYRVIAERQVAHDTMMWQVPALSLTAQAFLYTVALLETTPPLYRLVASSLIVLVAVLSAQLLLKQRYSEHIGTFRLERIEKTKGLRALHKSPQQLVSDLRAEDAEQIGLGRSDWRMFPRHARFTMRVSSNWWLVGLVLFAAPAWWLAYSSLIDLSTGWPTVSLPGLVVPWPGAVVIVLTALAGTVALWDALSSALARAYIAPAGWIEGVEFDRIKSLIPIVCVDLAVADASLGSPKSPKIGLVCRRTDMGGWGWTLIGGRIRIQETVQDAAERHLRESLGPNAALDWSGRSPPTVGEYFRTPRVGSMVDSRKRAISLTFLVPLTGEPKPQGPDHEAAKFEWFAISDLPWTEMGFGQEDVLRRLLVDAGLLPQPGVI